MHCRSGRVAIFRADLLPISETFIRDQAAALTEWEPILLGRREVEGGLQTPALRREIVSETQNRIVNALRFWLALPDPNLVIRLKALQIDLVHAHFATDATDVWPSVRAAGLPMVVTLHGYDINILREWWEAGHGGLRRRVYPRRLLRMAEEASVSFIAVSHAVKRRAIACGIPEGRIAVGYTGVDTCRFIPGGLPSAQRSNRILFVGRMVENKAPLSLIRAFAALKQRIEGLELVMVGDGQLLDRARSLASSFRVEVSFRGAASADEVLQELHKAKVLCLPSQMIDNGASEGLGQVILEAQACGVPVVAAATGGIPEALLDGVTGYIFPAGDEHALQAALLKVLLSEPSRMRELSERCREFAVQRFDLRKAIRSIQEIYGQRLANAPCVSQAATEGATTGSIP